VVDPIVTFGYGPESRNLPTFGYGNFISVITPVVEEQQGATPQVILKKTVTFIRIDIDHVYGKRFKLLDVVIGKFAPDTSSVDLNIEKFRNDALDIAIRHINIELASKLNRIVTGNRDISVKTENE